jgi:hypothetical protein
VVLNPFTSQRINAVNTGDAGLISSDVPTTAITTGTITSSKDGHLFTSVFTSTSIGSVPTLVPAGPGSSGSVYVLQFISLPLY